jgi:hypothetical protein
MLQSPQVEQPCERRPDAQPTETQRGRILSETRGGFANAIAAAKDVGELPADLDATDVAEAILAHHGCPVTSGDR